MKKIYKFIMDLLVVQVNGCCSFTIPHGSKILDVQVQHGAICLWVEVCTDQPLGKRYFTVVGTGDELPKGNPTYVATVQQFSDVWHVYEI